MWSIFAGNENRSNRGRLTRRDLLRIGAFGSGLTLADALRAGGGPPRKSAIMIYLDGGPSHLDTYDLKPDAPSEIRGDFQPIATNVPGVRICEHFPRQAQIWDKLACLRSVIGGTEHSDSHIMTGYLMSENRSIGHPSLGAVVSKRAAGASQGVPPFVTLRGMSAGCQPGLLGGAHRPFAPSGLDLQNLMPDLTLEQLEDRQTLLRGLDRLRRDLDASGTMQSLDEFNRRAMEIIVSGKMRDALDLGREPVPTRERYRGIEQFLLARRLVDAGVGFVTLSLGFWDTHAGNFKTLRKLMPDVDRGVANLVEDLHDRNLSDDVVVIMWGEFGRTPIINANDGGRDHWPAVMSVLVAGGGLKMGQVVGSSSARAEYPKDRPYRVQQVLSTLYRALGIDPKGTLVSHSGRPVPIVDDHEPVVELL